MKIAIIKQGGLCAGGIEKYLQQIALELKESGCQVDYFYTDAVPCGPQRWMHPGTDATRKDLLETNNIGLFEVTCTDIDALESGGKWNNSNLFDLFNPNNYDVVVGGHKGEPCWPFSVIRGPKIVETVHGTDFTSGASKYADKYVLISDCQTEKWIRAGGDQKRTSVIAPMVYVDMSDSKSDRRKWNIPHNKVIFGMHQSARSGLFSRIPLDAYKSNQSDQNFFVILGGTEEYDRHASSIGLKNYLRIPPASSSREINSFLSCLDVYSHGRLDGEVCSSAIIEAMAHSLPIISHPSSFNNGHAFQIDGCGFMAHSTQEYSSFMKALEVDQALREKSSKLTKEKYQSKFNFERCKEEILNVIMS
jgi:glycosyltransferase involved in cell wall biosynthesis